MFMHDILFYKHPPTHARVCLCMHMYAHPSAFFLVGRGLHRPAGRGARDVHNQGCTMPPTPHPEPHGLWMGGSTSLRAKPSFSAFELPSGWGQPHKEVPYCPDRSQRAYVLELPWLPRRGVSSAPTFHRRAAVRQKKAVQRPRIGIIISGTVLRGPFSSPTPRSVWPPTSFWSADPGPQSQRGAPHLQPEPSSLPAQLQHSVCAVRQVDCFQEGHTPGGRCVLNVLCLCTPQHRTCFWL